MSTMTTDITNDLEQYLELISTKKTNEELEIFNSAKQFGKEDMQISWLQARFYQLLITLTNVNNILEIGTFVGFSATIAAKSLPENGKLISCEIEKKYYEQAVKNINKFNYNNKIEVILGDAKNTILENKISKNIYDLIFIDGGKENYPFYFKNLKNNLRKGGVFLIDNTLFKGEVIAKNKSEHAKKINELNNILAEEDDFMISHITLGDGMLIAIKK